MSDSTRRPLRSLSATSRPRSLRSLNPSPQGGPLALDAFEVAVSFPIGDGRCIGVAFLRKEVAVVIDDDVAEQSSSVLAPTESFERRCEGGRHTGDVIRVVCVASEFGWRLDLVGDAVEA